MSYFLKGFKNPVSLSLFQNNDRPSSVSECVGGPSKTVFWMLPSLKGDNVSRTKSVDLDHEKH